MKNKEENYYKTEYQQIPVTMLTKENLDKLEEHCKKTIHIERGIEHSVVLELLYKYRELETEKQNVIEKLEEKIEILEETLDLCETDGKIAKYRIDDLQEEIEDLKEILLLVKGEK